MATPTLPPATSMTLKNRVVLLNWLTKDSPVHYNPEISHARPVRAARMNGQAATATHAIAASAAITATTTHFAGPLISPADKGSYTNGSFHAESPSAYFSNTSWITSSGNDLLLA